MEFRQLGRERREHAAVTQSHIECQIPSLHVPCSAKRLAKSVEVAAENAVVRAGIEHADASSLPARLRLDGERRGEEAASQSAEESPPGDH
jgi:hypothetical protein